MSDAVLVVAEAGDLHADAVCAILRRDHDVEPIRVDTTAFPEAAGSFHLGGAGGSRCLGGTEIHDVRSVWWRRAFPCRIPPSVNRDDDEFRQAECDAFAQGLLWSVEAVWINDPGCERVASRKIVQLAAARAAGLAVPETLITNDPGKAAEFIDGRARPTIYKRTGTSRAHFAETRLITADEVRQLGGIRTAPTTFQEYVEAEADLRIVWLPGEVWAVRIDSQSGAGWLDSRLDNRVDFSRYELPPATVTALGSLMARLGLAFGVIDMRIGRDGEIYFLEVNPQGQFAYLEFKTELPIFESLASCLARPAGRLLAA